MAKQGKSDFSKKVDAFKANVVDPGVKATFAIGATGLVYASAYTVAKTVTNKTPINADKVDSYLRHTDQGLVAQTALMIGSTGLTIKFLESKTGKTYFPDFFTQFKPEKKIMYASVAGLAVGRLLSGVSVGKVGQRFQALADGNLPAAIYPAPGPYLNRPSNIRELDKVITRPTANSPAVISSNYYTSVYQPKLETQLSLLSRNSNSANNAALNQSNAALNQSNAAVVPGNPTLNP